MLSNTRIFVRLGFLTALLLAFIGGLSVISINGMSHMRDGIRTVYEDRTIPLGQLSQIRGLYYEIRLAVVASVNSNDVEIARKREADIDGFRKEIAGTWDLYISTFLTPDEKKLVAEAEDNIKAYDEARGQVFATARSGDFQGARTLAATGPGGTNFVAIMKSITDLSELQVDVAREEYKKANDAYARDFNLAIGGMILALLLGGAPR